MTSSTPGKHPCIPAAPLGRKLLTWSAILLFLIALFLPGIFLRTDRYWLPLFSRYLALSLFAMSVDLIWGYTGLLSLGQGLYFGLGAYAVGYSLKLQKAALDAGKPLVAGPDMALPDFMEYCRLPAVPGWIAPLINIWLALTLAVLVPLLVATLVGFITFRSRVKGVYFSLVTQALVLAAFTLVVNQQPYTGGVVGMTYLAKLELFGHKFQMSELYFLIAAVVVVSFLACAVLVRSKLGKILTAIRDNETRILALGYSTAMYKTFIFAVAGALAGIAGALYVSAYGTTGPDSLGIGFSIEVIVFVAVGGRGTLVGAILGTVLVNLANTYINNEYKEAWPIILGCLFIGVVLLLPDGILGGLGRLMKLVGRVVARRIPISASSQATPATTSLTTESPPHALPAMVSDLEGT
jgi:urea transport system permease protein